ncbi:MAG: methionyl-tRNA formyltransferase [Deltaproteobacteria bacterium]|nr:methionyl-tRNA formyltransferase [Deltaproteobacteria bacterium]
MHHLADLPGHWTFIGDEAELSIVRLRMLKPRYVFFLHWSMLVPLEITREFECVCFHMTDVPYGRGGSPLQNLIVRGHRETKLTALRMVPQLDAGPIYFKEPLSLTGRAQDIYKRAEELSVQMIRRIIEEEPDPSPQVGEPVIFSRRKPHQSRIKEVETLSGLYDRIRMVDADGYPYAFLEHENLRLEFRNARLLEDCVVAEVTIRMKEGDG